MTEEVPPDARHASAATERLLGEAIDLVIRRQNAPDNPVTLQTIRLWRARSPEHDRIWQVVWETHGLSGAALDPRATGPRIGRRTLMIGGAIGVAGIAGQWGAPWLRLRMLADHQTAKAELREIEMDDGTRITLGPASAIAFPAGTDRREVQLLQGMGWFDVASAPDSPFMLRVGKTASAWTTSASFEASLDASLLNVIVARDRLDFRGAASAPEQRVEAGHWLRVSSADGAQETGVRDAALAGTWQQGLLLAEAEPLESVVARIARWLPSSVVVADDRIAQARISGIFDLANPESALEAAIRPTGARLRRIPGLLTVVSGA